MSFIDKTAFEVSVSNITRNNTQNVPGYFGSVPDAAFVGADCSAGLLCVKNALTESEGYEAQDILNGNTWQFIAAANGTSADGFTGDHTGLYACNTYDVRQVNAGNGNIYKLGANFLGAGLPANVRGDFTEIIIGEQYTFGEGNFSTLPSSASYIYATISSGRLVASSSKPTGGNGVYFEILRKKDFTVGARSAGFSGYVCVAKRTAQAAG